MSERRSVLGWPAALVLIVLIAAGAVYLSVREAGQSAGRMFEGGANAAEKLAGAVSGLWNVRPQVVYDDSVVVERGTGVARLVVVEHPVEVSREMSHEFLRSTKRLRIEGEFLVLAGFDLDKPFSVTTSGELVEVVVPAPEVLGVETVDIEVREMRDGLWNKLRPEEIEQAVNDLPGLARSQVGEMAILDQAVAEFEDSLRERLGGNWSVRVTTATSTPDETAPPLD